MEEQTRIAENTGLLNDYDHLETEEADSLEEYTDFLQHQYQELDNQVVKTWADPDHDEEKLQRVLSCRDQIDQVLTEFHERGYIDSVLDEF